MDFNKLNSHLYQQAAPYRFSKNPNNIDKGYLKISDWLADLCFYYEKKREAHELSDEEEFKQLIQTHKKNISDLKESDYKQGLLKAINEIT